MIVDVVPVTEQLVCVWEYVVVNDAQEVLVISVAYCTAQLETVSEAVHSELVLMEVADCIVLVSVGSSVGLSVGWLVGLSLSAGLPVARFNVQSPMYTPNIFIHGR